MGTSKAAGFVASSLASNSRMLSGERVVVAQTDVAQLGAKKLNRSDDKRMLDDGALRCVELGLALGSIDLCERDVTRH